jgi:glycosyltransferase involved in cell wall biosynthesis
VAELLVKSDVLTFPSIREFGGAVVLEAMAVGVVPIVVDYGGPGELATRETGYLIELGDRGQIVQRLREILTHIVDDPSQLEPRSKAAIDRVDRYFTWEAKAEQIFQVYRWVLGQRSDKPIFPMPFPDPPSEQG